MIFMTVSLYICIVYTYILYNVSQFSASYMISTVGRFGHVPIGGIASIECRKRVVDGYMHMLL